MIGEIQQIYREFVEDISKNRARFLKERQKASQLDQQRQIEEIRKKFKDL